MLIVAARNDSIGDSYRGEGPEKHKRCPRRLEDAEEANDGEGSEEDVAAHQASRATVFSGHALAQECTPLMAL